MFQKTVVAILVILVFSSSSYSQYEDLPPQHLNEYAMGITLSMSGFGLGGIYRKAFPNYFHVGLGLDFYMINDENEFTYYNYVGYPIKINDFNRLFLIPLSAELKRRLFYNDVEDSFRPYIVGLGGITFGLNFPRDNDIEFSTLPPAEQERLPREDEFRLSFNLGLGVGIDFTTNENFYLTVRPQYRFIYFPKAIAGKTNHSNFEIRVELGKRK
jgi:hypothetical protein